MEIVFCHKNLSEAEKKQSAEYFQKKRRGIEHLLTHYDDDEAILYFTIEKFEKHNAFQTELRLMWGPKALIAAEASHQISKSIDLAKDRLVGQIKKHSEKKTPR